MATKIKPLKVLITDDHAIFRNGLKGILTPLEYIKKVSEAGTGKEALAVLQKEKHEIVLMDIQMPEMDGIEATREITLRFPNCKVIALTTFDDSNYILEMKTNGAKGFLLKSTTIDEITDAIATVLSGEYYFTPSVLTTDSISKIFKDQDQIAPYSKVELSPREIEVIKAITRGKGTKETADILHISEHTLRKHRQNIYKKLAVSSMAALVSYAAKKNWLK